MEAQPLQSLWVNSDHSSDDGLIPTTSYCQKLDLILVSGVGDVFWGATRNIYLVIEMSERKYLFLFLDIVVLHGMPGTA